MISKIAGRLYGQMETATREDGSKFWRAKEDAEEALHDLIHEAHGGMMPDDVRYEMIANVLSELSELDEDDDRETAEDRLREMEPPVYNADRIAWLGSNLNRAQYVDEAVSEMGYSKDGGLFDALGWGYLAELREVADSVLSSLVEIAESETDEGE